MFQGEEGAGLPVGFGPGYQYGMEDDPELAMVCKENKNSSLRQSVFIIFKNFIFAKGSSYLNGREQAQTGS
jgi:hypothetical protein